MGRISGLYGVHGWLRVFSYTEPRENIVAYRRWLVRRPSGWQPFDVVEGRPQGKGVVVSLAGVTDRDQARDLLGSDVAILRGELPQLAEGEYYWADLEGLEVFAGDECLGTVSHLVETGANDVMVVKGARDRMIPFVPGLYVTRVDLSAGRIEVDWDPDF